MVRREHQGSHRQLSNASSTHSDEFAVRNWISNGNSKINCLNVNLFSFKHKTYVCLIAQAVVDNLKKKGHNMTEEIRLSCAVYAISVESDGLIYANADYRKGGDVAGIDPVFDE